MPRPMGNILVIYRWPMIAEFWPMDRSFLAHEFRVLVHE